MSQLLFHEKYQFTVPSPWNFLSTKISEKIELYQEGNQTWCTNWKTWSAWVSTPSDTRQSAPRRNRQDCLSPESRETPTRAGAREKEDGGERESRFEWRWKMNPRERRDNARDEDNPALERRRRGGRRASEGDATMVFAMRRLSSRVLTAAGGFRG